MKLKKKTTMIISFAIGTLMFSTTAMAEVISKTGYDQLKDSVKFTADSCTTKLSSYTMDMSFVIKDNGTVVFSESDLNKYSVSKQAKENTSTNIQGKVKRENYYYADKNGFINKDSKQNIYYVNEYEKAQEVAAFSNPFKEKQAGDVEKILDALVGNLKDAVVVTQNSDGSKVLSGSLNESQIPALVNAVVSLQSKSVFNTNSDNESYMPKITNDIFVKDVTGKMTVGKDGVIRSVLGSGILYGKDENGKEHNVTFELLGKLSNINSTVVNKPDLTGKTVEKQVQKDYGKLTNPQIYIGQYKTNIIIEKDGKFQKIGEGFVDITQMDQKSVSGSYHEEYVKGYENYGTYKNEFKFSGTFIKDQTDAEISATDASGATFKGHISIDQHSASIYFNINESKSTNILSNSQYNRVFN